MIAQHHLSTLKQDHWFRTRSPQLQALLWQAGQLKTLRSKQRLFARGQPFDGMYAVLEGTLRIFGYQHKEALLALVSASQWFGEIALIDGLLRTHEVVAEQDTLLLWIPAPALDALLQQHPAYWRDFALLVTHKIRLIMQQLEETSVSSVEQRVLSRLLFMVDAQPQPHGLPLRLQLSQEQLAELLAVSRQTVNGCLKQFEQKGWIKLGYRCIDVLDIQALQQMSQP